MPGRTQTEPLGCYGERLLPVVIDDLARKTPNQVHTIVSRSPRSYSEGAAIVTYAGLANAIDHFAWFLQEILGGKGKSRTFAYFGPNDLRYMAVIVAAMKVGHTLLLSAPLNSVSNHLNLIDKTRCDVILKDDSIDVDHIVSACPTPIRVVNAPSYDTLFTDAPAKPYVYAPTFASVKNKPVFVLHSSGSTGQVKPIVYTHGSVACLDKQHYLEQSPSCQSFFAYLGEGRRSLYNPMPLFHGTALLMGLVGSTFFQYTYMMAPSAERPTKENVLEHLSVLQPKVCLIAPSTLEEMTEDSKALSVLGLCDVVMFGGGPLSDYAAGVVSKHIRLQTGFGSTEGGVYPICMLEDHENDYHYYRFVQGSDPASRDMDFRPIGDGTYQLYLTRTDGVEWSSIFHTFPDKDEYDTSDMWRRHPTKEGLWKHVGRSDDVIVLSNGKKVSPSFSESILHGCPELREVLLAGRGRFQVSLIVELEEFAQTLGRQEVLRRLDPFLKKANREMPAHAQLSADYTILAPATKPLSRAPKGTIARNDTYMNFEEELNDLYEHAAEANVVTSSTPLLQGADRKMTLAGLTALFERVIEVRHLSPNQNYLALGIDSLKAVGLVRNIRAQLKAEGAVVPADSINNSLVYSNPTLSQLADTLRKLASPEGKSARGAAITDVLTGFVGQLPKRGAPIRTTNLCVAVTGTTGSLGCYLLAQLLQDPAVSKIYALNRYEHGHKRQTEVFYERKLRADFGDRVHFRCVDLSQPQFGLDACAYDELVREVDVFVHNAWPVDWNMPLEAFRPHLTGLANLIDFAVDAPNKPAILFTSSVATAFEWCELHPDQAVPERIIEDPRAISHNGYSQGKWIAERLLAEAGRVSGTRSANVRVGQLAGAVHGPSVWKRDEWFPSLIAASAELGALPSSLGSADHIDFVPVDHAARILLDLVFDVAARPHVDPERVYNMLNPTPVPFEAFVPAISEQIKRSTGRSMKVVHLEDWVRLLRESSNSLSSDQVGLTRAIKLLDFFEGLCPPSASKRSGRDFVTAQTLARSSTMKGLPPVSAAWMESWLRGFGFE